MQRNSSERVAFLLLSATLCVLMPLAPAIPASLQLPSIVQPASREHHPGKVIWADLVTPDLQGAKRFYGGLFGWTFEDLQAAPTGYTVARLDGEPVAGLVYRPDAGRKHQPSWLTFIAVKDVDAAQRVALSHGARLLSQPRTYPKRGRQAVLADPQGARFAVLASSSGDPADFLAEPGDWIWSSLLTRDPDADAAFYQDLFGYEVFDPDTGDGLEHLVLSSDGYARASLNALPDDSSRRFPHWLSYVRVSDAAAAASRAVQLGGKILVEPHSDRQGGHVAVIADSAGAPLGLLEWSGDEPARAPDNPAGAAK